MNDKREESLEPSPDDDALRAALAAGDRDLEPDAATDARILAASRRGVGAGPEPLGWTARHPLVRPLATAALLVLSVGVVTLLVDQDQAAPSLPRPAAPAMAPEPPAARMAPLRKPVPADAPEPRASKELDPAAGAPAALAEDQAAPRDGKVAADEAPAGMEAGGDASFEALTDEAAPAMRLEDPSAGPARRADQPAAGAARQSAPELGGMYARPAPDRAADGGPVPGRAPSAAAMQAPAVAGPPDPAARDIEHAVVEILELCQKRRPYQAVLERFRLRHPGFDEARLRLLLGDCYLPPAR